MDIIKNFVSSTKYNIKCPYTMNPEFIVVHNTANDASARNEIAYMISNDNQVSFHYAVDDKEIVQGIPENRNAWHAGDGANGEGNRKGIAIEICYSKSGGDKFVDAEKLAAQFIASKLNEKGWGIAKVKKHQDFSGKYCPHRTLDMGWQRFLNMIQSYMNTNSSVSTASNNTANNTLYKVQAGAYNNKTNAEAQVTKLKKAGFDAVIITENKKTSMADEIKVGDEVKIKSDAYIYGTKTKFASFVYTSVLYVRQINGSKVVISTQKTGAVTGIASKNDLIKI